MLWRIVAARAAGTTLNVMTIGAFGVGVGAGWTPAARDGPPKANAPLSATMVSAVAKMRRVFERGETQNTGAFCSGTKPSNPSVRGAPFSRAAWKLG